jgi:hypothetical protein
MYLIVVIVLGSGKDCTIGKEKSAAMIVATRGNNSQDNCCRMRQ